MIFNSRNPNFCNLGSSVSKYAGQNVHKRLIAEESYKEQNWEMALKKAFLGTDEDLLSSKFSPESVIFEEKFIPLKRGPNWSIRVHRHCRAGDQWK